MNDVTRRQSLEIGTAAVAAAATARPVLAAGPSPQVVPFAAPPIDYRLTKCLREGTPTDMNVYDAAALRAVVELSVQSVGKRSRPVDFPDFTRGRWRTTPPLGLVHV